MDGRVKSGGRGVRAAARPTLIAAGIALALGLPGDIDAQQRRIGERPQQTRREGQWLSVGLGGGFDQVTCEVCQGSPESGPAGFVRFGGTISQRLQIGAEFDGWTRGDEGIRQYMGSLQAVAVLYADPVARFHFKLGAGAVGFRASEEGEALTALTIGASGGIGYDLPITETVSLVPFANLVLAPYSTLRFNGDEAVGGATLALLHGGLSITWH